MANYSLVIGSRFSPFTYEELLQPALMATQAHQELENEYSELATKASIWEEMANEQTDPYAYNMYKTYANDLEEQANILATEGLNPASRKNMLKIKQRYASDILPIEQAYTRRNQLAEEQRQALLKDPSLMFERMASQMSLDDFIKNPEANYGSSYSGNLLRGTVAEAASNLTKQMKENPRTWRSILGGQYYETVMQRGFTSDDIIRAIQDPEAIPELTRIVNDAIDSSGIMSWGDEATKKKALTFAQEGLWNAVGDTQYQIQANNAYVVPDSGNTSSDYDDGIYYRSVPRTSVSNVNTTQMNKDLESLIQIMNNPELLKYADTVLVTDMKMVSGDPQMGFMINTGIPDPRGKTVEKTRYPYQEELERLSRKYGKNITIKNGIITEGDLEEFARELFNNINTSAVRSFTYNLNITQNDLIASVLKGDVRTHASNTGSTGMYELKGRDKGKPIEINEINNYLTSDSNLEFDPNIGFVIHATDSNGKTRSAVLDTELLDTPDRRFNSAVNSINIALDNGEGELANTLIEGLMRATYKKFNTLKQRQSNTSSKEE